MKQLLGLIALFVLAGCGTSEQTKKEENPDSVAVAQAVDSAQVNVNAPIRRYAEGMDDFRNIEWVEYCLPIPFDEYEELPAEESVKGRHEFIHRKNRKDNIVVIGMEREDPSVSFDNYFKNCYAEAEEEGKIITEKAKLNSYDAFYVIGYWNNKIYEERFIEFVWLRKTEVVKFTANISVKDTAAWRGRIVSLCTVSSECN